MSITFPAIISFLLTLIVLLYLIGDNPAFRVVVYIFVGVSAGYAASIAWWQVLMPRMVIPIFQADFINRAIALISLVLGVLLMMKLSPRTARLGSPVIAFMVGIGAAVAIGGAVIGTLFPQIQASYNVFGPSQTDSPLYHFFEGCVMLIGTVTTLVYFHFGAKSTAGGPQRNKLVVILSWVGQIFIGITLGALFAGVFSAALTALIDRLHFLWVFLATLLHL
jgi:hypothetical protein